MTVLAALSALALSVTPVAAQTAPARPAAQAAAPAPAVTPRPAAFGVSPAAVIAWINTQGATAGEVQTDQGRQFIRVDADGLAWLLFFQSCENGLCSDVQFTTGVANAAVTPDMINGWNRDRRFLKAIYEAPEGTSPPSAVIQYDVLLNAGGPEQLADHLSIWRGLLPEFARLTTGAAAAAPAPAPASPAH
jgi:hypothetical protein